MPHTKPLPPNVGPQTIAVHGGETPDPITGASAPSIVMSTTFLSAADASFSSETVQAEMPYVYTRWGNPTVKQLEQKLALMEKAEACVAFGSGMAAITGLLLHRLGHGDHLLLSDVSYAALAELSRDLLPRMGVEVTYVNMSQPDAVRSALRPNTKLVYIETPTNPILRLTDISALVQIAHEGGAELAVDSTFATPAATQPIALGADFVVHSLTKYLGGHGDAIGGALLGRESVLADLRKRVAIRTGGILSPFNAWLILRGLATFPLRMRAHEEGALVVARFLEKHPWVTRVCYPGLPSHPQHELAKRQMRNFSGMLTFQVRDSARVVRAFASELAVIHYAVSLGHQRSLVFYLPTDELQETSFHLSGQPLEEYRAFAGDGIFRLSVGIEDPIDLCRDLEQALARVA